MKSPVKVRVFVESNTQNTDDRRGGKRYKVTRWIFECKTGRTVDNFIYGTNYSLKEARAAKKMILDSYFG